MNPYELNGRYRKVTAFIDYLWATMSEQSRRDPIGPWTVSEADEAWWEDAAARAGINVPSEKTRAEIVVALAKRVNSERRGQTDPCDRCQGSGVEHVYVDLPRASYYEEDRPCPDCHATGKAQCEACREETGTVVVPLGLYGPACAEKHWPEIARHARMIRDPFAGLTERAAAPRQNQGASQRQKVAG